MIYDHEKRTIETERLILRLFEMRDAEKVVRICNNFKMYRYTLTLPYPYTIENATTWIENHSENFDKDIHYTFAITDKFTGELYGSLGLSYDKTNKKGELGYIVAEEQWGHGYATEGTKAMIEFAFDVKKYHKVFAVFFSSNPASGRVLEKAGMIFEGKQVDHVYKLNQYHDLISYAVINKE